MTRDSHDERASRGRRARWLVVGIGALLLAVALSWRLGMHRPGNAGSPTAVQTGPTDPSAAAPNRDPASVSATPAGETSPGASAGTAVRLLEELAALMSPKAERWTQAEHDRVKNLESRLLSLGSQAVEPMLARLDRGTDAPATREFLFHVLRQLPPDPRARTRIIAEARASASDAMRTMAIETLGQRSPDGRVDEASVQALATIARSKERPPVSVHEEPSAPGEEPHDEGPTFRLRAMAALEALGDPRAARPLVEMVKDDHDDSMRMYACRYLVSYATTLPDARDALVAAAQSDPSQRVRLAAINSLGAIADPQVRAALETIAKRDREERVRALARRMLERQALSP